MTKHAVLLVGSHSSPVDTHTILQAAELAKTEGAHLHCLYVHEELKWSSRLSQLLPDREVVKETLAEKAMRALTKQVQSVTPADNITCSVSFGHLFLEVIRYCQKHAITIVVKAAKEPGWSRMFLDSEDLHLLRKSSVPIWLTRPESAEPVKSVAVALDFDHDEEPESQSLNKRLLSKAIDIARMKSVPLHLINVFNIRDLDFATLWADDPGKLEQELLADEKVTRQAAMQFLISEMSEETPGIFDSLQYSIRLVNGDPAEQIAQTVGKLLSPLLVMGSVARSGVSGLFIGNTAESTLLKVSCPIVVMKPVGFVSPVSL
ncbi:universal stress protein [Alteromonas sp. H39]|uniref:universal stress protein n=1 Tax=Alteromonas sp. H39 TaxID=3389876 RepID=UPI0039E16B11